jgi:hypothetical protein
MQHTEVKTFNTIQLTGLYTLFLAIAVGAFFAIEPLLGIDSPISGFAAEMVAAMIMTMLWVRREKAVPSRARTWKVAVSCTLVTTALFIPLLAVVIAADNEMMRDLKNDTAMFAIVIGITLTLINLLPIRLGMWMGVKPGLNMAARAA